MSDNMSVTLPDQILTKLEDLVERQSRHFFNRAYGVDVDSFFDLTHQLRAEVPRVVEEAKRIVRDRDRVLDEAKARSATILREVEEHAATMRREAEEERESILAAARLEADELVGAHEITRRAQRRAEDLQQATAEETARLRGDAETYAANILDYLDDYLARVLASVRQGRAELSQRLTAAAKENNG